MTFPNHNSYHEKIRKNPKKDWLCGKPAVWNVRLQDGKEDRGDGKMRRYSSTTLTFESTQGRYERKSTRGVLTRRGEASSRQKKENPDDAPRNS